jgi:signal transduction histidine kinase/CheY-like chemotaxis protein
MSFSPPVRPYGAALLATMSAFLLCRLLGPSLDRPAAYLVFALAVLVSARAGGRGAALLATVIGALAGVSLLGPGRLQPADGIAAGLFLLIGLGIAFSWGRPAAGAPRSTDDGSSRAAAGVKGASVAPPAEERRRPAAAGVATAGRAPAAAPTGAGVEAETARRERDAERRLRRQLAVLHAVSLELSALASRDELCRQAVELGRQRLGFDRMGLWLQLDEPGVIQGSFGTDEQGQTRDERGLRLPIHVIPLAAQLLDRSARILRREEATLYGDHGNVVGRGTHVLAGLWEGDRFLGFLSADNLLSGRPIAEPEGEMLGLYAATVGHLCTRLTAEAALRESWDAECSFHRQLAALHDISLELSTAPDFDTLCRRAVELGRARLDFDRLGLWFRTEAPDQVRGSFGTDDTGHTADERALQMPIFPGTPTDRVLMSGERVAVLEDTRLFSQKDEEVRGTQVVAGLWNGQEAIGYLSADNRLRHRPVTEQEKMLLELYAATVGHLCTLKRREEAMREADRQKDEALAMLAHELRNPLAPIKNAVELVKQKLLRSPYFVSDSDEIRDTEYELRNTLAVIDRQVRQQSRLLDDLLDLSRIGQGKIELRTGRLDLVRLVRDAAEDRRGVLEAGGLTLRLELPDRPVWVEGDSARLTQVVGNLLANAGKFTPPGGQVTASVGREGFSDSITRSGGYPRHGDTEDGEQDLASRSSPPLAPPLASPGDRPQDPLRGYPLRSSPAPCLRVDSGRAVLSIADTGIGIEAEMLPRVFDAFAQADRALTYSQAGLGLGLALVRGLVERHGGQVRAESDGPGCGARFTVTLPVAEAPAEAEPARPAAPVPGGPLRILIIEDQPDGAETLRALLELFDCTVAVARNGLEGIETATQFRPDVVLCDLGLPVLDGYAVAAALRTMPATAHIRLIALSGRGQEEDQRRALEAGFDLHLTKPIDFDELQQLLEVAPLPRKA